MDRRVSVGGGLLFLVLVLAFGVALLPARAALAEDVDADTEVAQRRFAKGVAFYAAHEYEKALREFKEAKLARPLPAFDFNIARCLDRLERYEEAITAFERFVAASPEAADAQEAQERIGVLRARVEARKALDGPAVAPVPETPPPSPAPTPATVPAEAPAEIAPPAPTATPTATPAPPVATASAESPRRGTPVHRRWWLWTAVGGVVVAGVAVGLGVGLSHPGTSAPDCADCGYGTFRF